MSSRRALLSVSDKTAIDDFGRELVERGWELVSTGGTARALADAGLPVVRVAEVTGHPEMMEGRVKTLHPAIHAGVLARRNRDDDLQALRDRDYTPIDLVVVNLYPFRETVAGGEVELPEAMEQVDIGGPTLLRAAAKNHRDVWAVVDPRDYGRVLDALDGRADAGRLRRELAVKVFRHTAHYDAAVAGYLDDERADAAAPADREPPGLPPSLALDLDRVHPLRYGENPDQDAAFYAPPDERHGLAALEQRHGKELSYNNFLDLDGALLALSPFAFSPRPAVAIIKHTTPCGLAVSGSLEEAYRNALATDPMSAFGSIVAVNRPVDPATAAEMSELFIECIVAPGYAPGAFEELSRKKTLRLLVYPGLDEPVEGEPSNDRWWTDADDEVRGTARFLAAHSRLPAPRVLRSVYGGALVQTPPRPPFYPGGRTADWEVVTDREPTMSERDDLAFAWAAAFGVKSNAIVLARSGATLGIGAGQMSRVDASRIAVRKADDAGLDLGGSVLASDAFFPFRDGVDAAAEAGVTAIVQPGGSIRDDEVIEAADEHDIAMVFTGRRVFRH